MTKREAWFGERVNRRTVLLGGLGTVGAVAFCGAVYESRETPRDGDAAGIARGTDGGGRGC